RNPRALFPVRDDFIRSAWVRRDRTQRAQEYEELYPYLTRRSSTAPLLNDRTIASQTSAAGTPATRPVARETQAGRLSPDRHQRGPGAPSTKDLATAGKAATTPISRGCARSRRHMGVRTGSGNVAELRRAFRRLEPENMFRAPRVDGEPIWAYWGDGKGGGGEGGHAHGQPQPPLPPGRRASTKDGFVLVPAEELTELRAIEGVLRKERDVLNAHCLVEFNEGEVSAHRPLELTRMAVHDACGSEMANALREYRAWTARSRSRGDGGRKKRGSSTAPRSALTRGNRSTVMFAGGCGKHSRAAASQARVAELQRTPAGWRTLRWVMMKRQAELKSQAMEAAAMFAEEREQRLKERFLEAWERRHDYDLYCVLAGQFWPLEAQDFRACSRPGRKLFLEIEAPARVIMRMWRTCWPDCFRVDDRKRKGCLGFQSLWRGYRVRKRWHPVIRLRVRHGRRSIIRPCFSSWARLARVQSWARRRFEEIEGRWERSCFHAWAEWTANLAAERQRKLERAGTTLRNIAVYRSFRSWKSYTRTTRQAHRLYARAVGGTSMAAWVQYVGMAKRQRGQKSAAVTIQRHSRGYLARRRHRATQTIIHGFNRLMAARRARQFLRQALAAAHRMATEELLQSGCDAEITAGIAREEKRLAELQKVIKAADAAVRRAVTKRLTGGWLTIRPASRGGGELRREVRAVQEEWKALEAAQTAAAAATATVPGTTPANASVGRDSKDGGGGGGGLGGTWPKTVFPGLLLRKGRPKDMKSDARPDGGGDGGGGGRNSRPKAAPAGRGARGGRTGGAQAPAKAAVPPSSRGGTAEAEREAWRRILARERRLAREIVVHDFDARNPPPLTCCAPGCGRTFTQDEHYLAHWDVAGAADAARKLLLRDDPNAFLSRPYSPPFFETPQRQDRGCQKSPSRPTMPTDDQQCVAPSTGSTTGSTSTVAGQQQQLRAPADQQQLRHGCPAAESEAEAGHPERGGKGIASFHLVVADKADIRRVGGRGGGGGGSEGADQEESGAGFDLVSAYVTRVWGHGQAYNTLLFVDAVDAWRRCCPVANPAFAEGAAELRREFLCPGAPREASLPAETRRDLMRTLDTLPDDVLDGTAGGRDDGDESGDDDAGGGEEVGGDGRAPDAELPFADEKRRRETRVDLSDGDEGGRRSTSTAGNAAIRNSSGGSGGPRATAKSKTRTKFSRNKIVRPSATRQPPQQHRPVSAPGGAAPPPTASSAAAAAAAAAASAAATARNPYGLRPTSFDEAQFQALAHLSRVVGPGFWASDLGRRAAALHQQELKRRREAAHEIVRLERRGRLANEAAEVRRQLSRGRDVEIESLAQSAVDVASGSVVEALLRSAVAGAEVSEIQEVSASR
ncbi:unnamed protein product, partial [Ectocarpus sp. 12 AP-2014]